MLINKLPRAVILKLNTHRIYWESCENADSDSLSLGWEPEILHPDKLLGRGLLLISELR